MERVKSRPVIYRAARKVWIILDMIKFEHTLFALPFALIAAIVAANGVPKAATLLWILVAMVGARSSAMAFNRIVDLELDRLNPRTSNRALPKGLVSIIEAAVFAIVSAGLLVVAAYKLNPLAFALSPAALVVILGYSYTKRFTVWSHVVLGLALSIAPAGAWIAVTGGLDAAPLILCAAVVFWTAGFDIIYSLQDVEFDRMVGLKSLPQAFGVRRALLVSGFLHGLMVASLVGFGVMTWLGLSYYMGVGLVAAFLIYEHKLVSPSDISRVNAAFFTMNGFVSVGLLIFAVLDVVVR